MTSLPRGDALPLTEPIPLDSLAALRSPSADIRFTALRDFMLRMGLSLQPVRVDTVPKPPPKPKPVSSPVSPAPKRQYQKQKDREFKHALSHGVRHSYQRYIRDISTPDWTAPSPSPIGAAIGGEFDACDAHGLLEVCEHRIINGLDPERRHPAQCVEAAALGLEMTAAESEASGRYGVGAVNEKVPTFWPPRMWDKSDRQLSREESKALEDLLAMQGTEVLPKVVKPPVRVRVSPSPQQKVKKTTVVLLDMHDYKTDGSDADTDWDDF
jgi:hypothetical protein